MNRAGFMQFILEQYSVEPDYPWMKNPNFAVFRHSNNQKWFALIMDIPRSRLGLPGDELLDVVNISRIERGTVACSLELLIDLSNELHTSTDFLLTGIGPSNDFAKEEIDTAISILSSIKQLL